MSPCAACVCSLARSLATSSSEMSLGGEDNAYPAGRMSAARRIMTERACIKHYRRSAVDRQELRDCPHDCMAFNREDRDVAAEFVSPNPPFGCSKGFVFGTG